MACVYNGTEQNGFVMIAAACGLLEASHCIK